MTLSKKELGQLIKKARKLKEDKDGKKFTQKDLADSIKKSRSYIGDIEAGRTYPSYVLLSEIAKACGVSLDFFNVDNSIEEYIENVHKELTPSEKQGIKYTIKTDDKIKIDNLVKEGKESYYFENAQDAIKFILEQPALMAYGGYDLEDMSEEDIMELANDILLTVKVSIERRKK